MRKVRVSVAYDGTDFCGWQRQPDRLTVQGLLERELSALEGKPVQIAGSGRTDSGVHALGQVASFCLENPLPLENLRRRLNHRLPGAVRVLDAVEVGAEFHARHSATAKTYEYRIWRGDLCPPTLCRFAWAFPYPLDEAAMIGAAPRFEGTRDFQALAASGGQEMESTVRTVFSSRMARDGEALVYRVRGSGFLYRMVRNMVGVLMEVGRGNFSAEDVDRVLESGLRSEGGATAPARGLFLVGVEYGDTK